MYLLFKCSQSNTRKVFDLSRKMCLVVIDLYELDRLPLCLPPCKCKTPCGFKILLAFAIADIICSLASILMFALVNFGTIPNSSEEVRILWDRRGGGYALIVCTMAMLFLEVVVRVPVDILLLYALITYHNILMRVWVKLMTLLLSFQIFEFGADIFHFAVTTDSITFMVDTCTVSSRVIIYLVMMSLANYEWYYLETVGIAQYKKSAWSGGGGRSDSSRSSSLSSSERRRLSEMKRASSQGKLDDINSPGKLSGSSKVKFTFSRSSEEDGPARSVLSYNPSESSQTKSILKCPKKESLPTQQSMEIRPQSSTPNEKRKYQTKANTPSPDLRSSSRISLHKASSVNEIKAGSPEKAIEPKDQPLASSTRSKKRIPPDLHTTQLLATLTPPKNQTSPEPRTKHRPTSESPTQLEASPSKTITPITSPSKTITPITSPSKTITPITSPSKNITPTISPSKTTTPTTSPPKDNKNGVKPASMPNSPMPIVEKLLPKYPNQDAGKPKEVQNPTNLDMKGSGVNQISNKESSRKLKINSEEAINKPTIHKEVTSNENGSPPKKPKSDQDERTSPKKKE